VADRAAMVLALALVACDRRHAPEAVGALSSSAAMHRYAIEYFVKPALPRVSVTAEIPATWSESVSPQGAPSFAVPGTTGARPTITAIGLEKPDPAVRIERAMALQYGADTGAVVRTPLEGGRVWAVRREASVVHARMFVPAPHGVVMAVAIVRHAEADRLAEIEAVYRTVRVEAR
jgi:hypothetical protein